jgi:inosose dehydratase
MTDRRKFLKATGLGILASAIPGTIPAKSLSVEKISAHDIKLGIASYSFRNFPIEKALDMTLRCGIHRISFKSMHLELNSDEATIKKAVALCNEKGIKLYGGGVIYMKSQDQVDQAFEYARMAEMEMIIGVPNHDLLDYVEEKVKKYDIKLAIHNHGPGDEVYPSAKSAYDLIKNRDSRMGLCIDIGHTKRIGRDPEQDLKDFFSRVFDIHIKDVTKATAEGTTCTIGHGVINFVSFLKSAIKLGYQGTMALEYESEGNDPLPAMMESFGYIRGVQTML